MDSTAAPDKSPFTDPQSLVAITLAARHLGDRQLERAAKQRLADCYGIVLTFRRIAEERDRK